MKNYRLLTWVLAGMLCLSVIGCASSSKKVVLDDQTIANSIKSSLEAPTGPQGPFVINIFVDRGEVQLEGNVPNTAAKEQAIEIAHIQDSVTDVKSFLVVK
ncbi:MAG: BON domain-containing protein [Candidatus Omnitrophica bacterium]|nr:BON domain-containing protein [Candidatus Omnitrophota bacterium]